MRLWWQSVGETSFLGLIFVAVLQVPLALLAGIDGYLLYMTPAELFHAVSFLLLANAAAVVVFSLGFLLPALPFFMVRPSNSHRMRGSLTAIAVAAFLSVSAYWLIHILVRWCRALAGGGGAGPDALSLALVAVAICIPAMASIFRSEKGLQRWHARCMTLRAPALAILAVAAIGVLTADLSIYSYGRLAAREQAALSRGRPNVVLITIDTLSAADMSLYGYRIATTPNLDRFARSSHVFDRFFAASNFTTPAIVSLLTGRNVDSHRVFQLEARVTGNAAKQNIAAVLRGSGYLTAAFVGSPYAHPLQTGLAAGFDFVQFPPRRGAWGAMLARVLRFSGLNLQPLVDPLVPWLEPLLSRIAPEPFETTPFPAEHVFDQARRFLAAHGKEAPLFVWIHIMPPHDPYLPPAPYLYSILPERVFDKRSDTAGMESAPPRVPQPVLDKLRLRYDEHIRYADGETGRFLDELRAGGLFESSVVIVAADHGESFGRGWVGHNGPYLYQSLIHVPLIVHLPGQTRGSRVAAFAQHADVAPTLLDMLALPGATSMEGESLLPAMNGRPLAGLPKFSMNLQTGSRFGNLTSGTVAVMADGHKYIRYLAGRRDAELYDLGRDPGEERDLAGTSPELVQKFEAMVRARLGGAFRQR